MSTAAVSVSGRVQKNGLHLPAYQHHASNTGLSHMVITIPSDTAPSLSSYFMISLKETNILIHQMCLQVTMAAITGSSLSTARYVPLWWLFTRLELLVNGSVIDTLYPTAQFLKANLFEQDEDRRALNMAVGLYFDTAVRAAGSGSSQTFYVPLKTFLDQCNYGLLTAAHSVQLRVYTDSLANITSCASGTISGGSVSTVNLIVRCSRLSQVLAQQMIQEISVKPLHALCHQCRYLTTSIAVSSSTTAYNIPLTSIVGNVAYLLFCSRTVGSTSGDNYYTPNALTSFALLDSTSANIVGGQFLPVALVQNYLMMTWTSSSFSTETNSQAVTDKWSPFSGANFYMYSFSADPIQAFKTGSAVGSRQFTGTEQLSIYFPSGLTSTTQQIELFCYTECLLTQTAAGVTISSI